MRNRLRCSDNCKKLMKNIKQQLLLQVEKMLLFKIIKLSNYQMVPLLQKSQAGCLLGGLVAGFLFRNTHPSLQVLEESVSYYNIAAEIAEKVKRLMDLEHFYLNYLMKCINLTMILINNL